MNPFKLVAFCLSLPISVLFIHLTLIANDIWYMNEMADTYRRWNVCLPCDAVLRHLDDHVPFVERSNLNGSVCCLTDNKDIDKFMHQVVKIMTSSLASEHRPTHGCKRPYTEILPMIKLVGHDRTIQGLDPHTVQWDVTSEMTIQHDVDYAKGRIQILTPGTYFVYSSLTFVSDRYTINEGPPVTLHFHRMMQQKDLGGQETVIDQRIFPNCRTSASQSITTSRLEAVVSLNNGDSIYVMVHNTSAILPVGPSSNYFGVHIIA